jgi:hypothetical protein
MDANANPAAVKPQKKPAIHPDWWSKTLAGAVLGLTLAFAVCGLFAWWGPGGISAPNKVQFVMWMITPLWLVIFSLVYLFRTGLRAVLWLLAANLLAYLLLWISRGMPVLLSLS